MPAQPSDSPSPAPPAAPRLLGTLIGRLFLLSGGLLLAIFLVRQLVELPDILQMFRRVVAAAFLVSSAWLLVQAAMRSRRQLLWRVRVKLILSYVFLGLVPVVLVVTFALAGGQVLYNTIASYLFHDGMQDLMDDVRQTAIGAAADLGRSPADTSAVLERRLADDLARYPNLALAVVPAEGVTAPVQPAGRAGTWRHGPPPDVVPDWLGDRPFAGLLVYTAPGGESRLLVRAAAPITGLQGVAAFVVADLPIDTPMIATLDDRTGTRIRSAVPDPDVGRDEPAAAPETAESALLFRRTVAFMDYVADWHEGTTARVQVSLEASISRLYQQMMSVQPAELMAMGGLFLALLALLGVLFLVVQGAALVMGALLARSITSAVHQLFIGTERVRQGDFTHRIEITSRDQLGDLAESFNRMSSSIEHLLHVQREKQRLDDELRIAREIQKSLLPDRPPAIDGLQIADLCEPAREVGGDYYDFFVLGPRRLGVMIADVSGKGTSAALYMSELKGLMLALSHDEPSPRQLLVEVNQHLAGQLDNRSFITMTYAIIDLDAGQMTFARAGHTPMLAVSGDGYDLLQPDGMVLGLRLPGAEERFGEILHEMTRPVRPGDVFVLYTDGVTEAMDAEGELFGDTALAELVTAHRTLDPAGIRERVVREVRAFAGDAEAHDDMTMVILKVADGRPA